MSNFVARDVSFVKVFFFLIFHPNFSFCYVICCCCYYIMVFKHQLCVNAFDVNLSPAYNWFSSSMLSLLSYLISFEKGDKNDYRSLKKRDFWWFVFARKVCWSLKWMKCLFVGIYCDIYWILWQCELLNLMGELRVVLSWWHELMVLFLKINIYNFIIFVFAVRQTWIWRKKICW